MDKIEEIVREVFNIPPTYILSKSEKKRLFASHMSKKLAVQRRLVLIDCWTVLRFVKMTASSGEH